MNSTIVLVGHRGVGKSTLGELIEQLGIVEVHDIDLLIEEHTGKSCADLVNEDEANFRQLETIAMDGILSRPSYERPRLVIPGAGCQHLPLGPIYVWLRREGWEDIARHNRSRLRPELEFEQEIDWMRMTREPTWVKRAHAVVDIPRNASLKISIQWLGTMIRWLSNCAAGELSEKLWLVPTDPDELRRAHIDQLLFRLGGIEIRSDFFPKWPAPPGGTPYITSLRTPDTAWLALAEQQAFALDVDIDLLEFARPVLESATPKPLILSTHPERCEREDLDALLAIKESLATDYPDCAEHIQLKFAPTPSSYRELFELLEHPLCKQRSRHAFSLLPQGDAFAWLRPWLAAKLNETNYLPVSPSPWRTEDAFSKAPAPYDLQSWLPFLIGATPNRYDALLGDPVRHSIGDVWHRTAALRRGDINRSYLKIPFSQDSPHGSLDDLLELMARVEIRGVSVTSPLKRFVAAHERVETDLDALNTLRRHHDRWKGTDTDEHGMYTILRSFDRSSIRPGEVAIIGKGGVSPAIIRAIQRASGWHLAHHASAREGWGEDAPEQVTLVINAAGNRDSVYDNPPSCKVWLDLHYHDVRKPPCDKHMCGAQFFEIQAEAQREFWTQG